MRGLIHLAAAATLVAAVATIGCRSREDPAPTPSPAGSNVPAARMVSIEATGSGFVPAVVELQPGELVTLRFTRTTTSGCMSQLALPELGISRELPVGVPIDVPVTAPAQGELAYECGMAMFRGRLVVGGPAGAPKATTSSAAKPHADHEPRHGGVVTMEGDLHVEIVVARDGLVDLYVSDAIRTPISPAEITGTLTLQAPGKSGDRSTMPLAADAAKGSLSARTPSPNATTEYTWDLRVRGHALHMTLAVPAGGTAAFATPQPGAAPKPIRRALGSGHVELVLAPSGELRLELLDASQKHASADGAAATVRVKGREVVLERDAATDVLRGDLGSLGDDDHVDAVVTITQRGRAASTLRVTFHREKSQR